MQLQRQNDLDPVPRQTIEHHKNPNLSSKFSRPGFSNMQRSNCHHLLDHWKSKRVSEKHLLLLYSLCQSLHCVDHSKLWKILKDMGIPGQLTCLLRNLYAGQEATIRTRHGTTDWFKIGKGVRQSCILSRVYLTYMQSTSREMRGWMKHKLESRLLGEISITSDMQNTWPLWQKVMRNLRASW